MRKNIYLLILPLLLILASCQKNEYVVPNRTILTTIYQTDWKTNNGGKTLFASIDMPEIDSYFNDHGGVLVYASFGDRVYEQIPEVYEGISYSYTHQSGLIQIEIQNSDGLASVTAPGTMDVKIVLVESN